MAGKFLDPLILEFLDSCQWRLVERFDFHLGTPDGRQRVIVTADFVTDFASVPRILWPLLPPTGPYGKAAVIHDRLYRHRTIAVMTLDGNEEWQREVTRAESDRIFLEGMGVLGVSSVIRRALYLAVRLGGWVPWRRYRSAERSMVNRAGRESYFGVEVADGHDEIE